MNTGLGEKSRSLGFIFYYYYRHAITRVWLALFVEMLFFYGRGWILTVRLCNSNCRRTASTCSHCSSGCAERTAEKPVLSTIINDDNILPLGRLAWTCPCAKMRQLRILVTIDTCYHRPTQRSTVLAYFCHSRPLGNTHCWHCLWVTGLCLFIAVDIVQLRYSPTVQSGEGGDLMVNAWNVIDL